MSWGSDAGATGCRVHLFRGHQYASLQSGGHLGGVRDRSRRSWVQPHVCRLGCRARRRDRRVDAAGDRAASSRESCERVRPARRREARTARRLGPDRARAFERAVPRTPRRPHRAVGPDGCRQDSVRAGLCPRPCGSGLDLVSLSRFADWCSGRRNVRIASGGIEQRNIDGRPPDAGYR